MFVSNTSISSSSIRIETQPATSILWLDTKQIHKKTADYDYQEQSLSERVGGDQNNIFKDLVFVKSILTADQALAPEPRPNSARIFRNL